MALAKGTARLRSFERPLWRKSPAADEWRLVAEKRLIALQIPDVRQEIPSGVGKGRLLLRIVRHLSACARVSELVEV
jgi:hypothetical protein